MIADAAPASEPRSKRAGRLLQAVVAMVREVVRASPFAFFGLCVIEALQGIGPVGEAWSLKLLLDELTVNHHRHGNGYLLLLVAAIVGFMVVAQFLAPLNGVLAGEIDRSLTLRIQSRIYQKLNSLTGIAHLEDPALYDRIQMAVQRAHHAPMSTLRLALAVARGALTVGGFAAALLVSAPFLILVAAVAVVPELALKLTYGRRNFSLASTSMPIYRLAGYFAYAMSNVTFARELRLLHLGDYLLRRFESATRTVNRQQRDFQVWHMRWQAVTSFISLGIVGAALGVVVLQVAGGRITVGDLALYLGALVGIQGGISNVFGSVGQVGEASLFFDQYMDVLSLPDPLRVSTRPRPVPPLRTGIEFRSVSFRYSERLPLILDRLDLLIPAGSTTALVGLNGAGKSTLVKLLMRMYDPVDGQILWDGIDLRDFDPPELRRQISGILQDFVHYDLTCRENIGFGQVSQVEDIAAVRTASRKAGIDGTILRLPNGYETNLSRSLGTPGGIDLSGGQWQSVGLARMLMREAPLLILDEPTAALDVRAENDLFSKFHSIIQGKTGLLISHRFSTVRMADTIAVLQDGQIVERGPHQDLMAAQGAYARLYSMQAEHYRVSTQGEQYRDRAPAAPEGELLKPLGQEAPDDDLVPFEPAPTRSGSPAPGLGLPGGVRPPAGGPRPVPIEEILDSQRRQRPGRQG